MEMEMYLVVRGTSSNQTVAQRHEHTHTHTHTLTIRTGGTITSTRNHTHASSQYCLSFYRLGNFNPACSAVKTSACRQIMWPPNKRARFWPRWAPKTDYFRANRKESRGQTFEQ